MWNWKLGFNHEKKLKEDAIENKIKFEKLIKIKQIKIKKGGEKNKWKITWWADMKMWRARHEFIGGRRKERKKKDVGDASEVWQLLASYKKKKKAEMNQMTWWNNIFYHQS